MEGSISLETGYAELDIDLSSVEAGPKRATSLRSRSDSLAAPQSQLGLLSRVDLTAPAVFDDAVKQAGFQNGLFPGSLEIFQINIGKLCNMTCRHCHVDAGPDRVEENMDRATVDACLAALDESGAHTVDITGGAPELNPHFEYLVDEAVKRGKHVMDRCNLTVLMLPKLAHLPEWLADRGVEVVCSLPHYRRPNTDRQRGDGTYEKSIEALRRLNRAGYGQGDPKRRLTLVTNPAGAFLPGGQASLEGEWKAALERNHEVSFDRLFAITNMPISRYLEWLVDRGSLETYMRKLVDAFNPAAVAGVMCRNTISVGWDGRLFDCDFNQMLDLEVAPAMNVHDWDSRVLGSRQIVTNRHCYGCTAGAGSSCGGSTA